jgi:two-component system sensor histidine kinase UhpB
VTAALDDGGALTMTWDGKAPVTKRQLALVAQLVSMVGKISAARRQADERFENQRQAWGQEIHDGVTQSVTAAILALQRVQSSVTEEVASSLIDATVDHVRQSLVDLREVLAYVVDDEGHLVGPASTESLQDLVDDVRTRWRVQARVSVRGDLVGVDREVASVATAIVREALINVAKHAGASRVTVSVTRAAAGLSVIVADDGSGLAPASGDLPRPGLRMGLRLLEQRVALAGGTLVVSPRTGGGTEVRAVLPIEA